MITRRRFESLNSYERIRLNLLLRNRFLKALDMI